MCDSRSASRFSRDDIVNTRGAQCKARDRNEEQRRVPARQAPFRILAAQGKSGIWDKVYSLSGRTYGQSDRKLTVCRPLQTPLRPGLYTLPSNDKTGHVVAPKALLVQQQRCLACCLPFTYPRSGAHLLVIR